MDEKDNASRNALPRGIVDEKYLISEVEID